jgi:hypothetical protein
MVNFWGSILWSVYPISWSVVGVWLMPRLTRRQRTVTIILIVVGVPLAVWSALSGRALDNRISSMDRQLSDPQTGLAALHGQLNESGTQISSLAKEVAACLTPGLKKDALELGSTLMNRGSQILIVTASSHYRSPDAWNQALKEQAQLMSDYKNTYASKVISLVQQFQARGEDWKNEQYYSNPTDAREVANVGMDLIIHANQLK